MERPGLATVTADTTRALARTVTDRSTTIGRKLMLLGGFTASGVRLARGTLVEALGPRPESDSGCGTSSAARTGGPCARP
jgi:hypothetical protein